MSYNLGTASGRIEIDGSRGAAGFKAVETAANAMFDVVKSKVDTIERTGRNIRNVGAVGVASFGLAVKAASSFETQMSAVQAVANGTQSEFDALRSKALQLGADTSFSASEAALAIEELAKAGIPIEDILNGAADATVSLAAAGGVALPEAATIASNAMNMFGISSDKVVKVADVLAGVANTSAADVSTLGQSLSQAGAVANLAGLSFRDTTIALGQMADAGIQGSDAGTSLKTMLNNLIPSTDRQIKEFERLGLLTFNNGKAMEALSANGVKPLGNDTKTLQGQLAKLGATLSDSEVGSAKQIKTTQGLAIQTGALSNQFFDAQGNVKSLGKLQGVLGDAMAGMTREQKLASLELLFGADSMRATAILSLAGAEGYREFSKAVSETSAAEVAKTRLDNLSGSIEGMKGAFETALITIGDIFIPVVTKVVDGITSMINVFNNLPPGVQTAIGVVAGIIAILAVLVGSLMAGASAIAAMVVQFYTVKVALIASGYLRTFFAAMRAGQGVMAAHSAGLAIASARTARLTLVTRIAGKALMLFGRTAAIAWALATGPIGIAVAAVVALIAVGVLLYKRWTPFRELVNKIGSALRDAFGAAVDWLMPKLERLGEFLVDVGERIKSDFLPALKDAGAQLKGAFGKAFDTIATAVTEDLLPAFESLGKVFTEDVGPALQDLYEQIAPYIPVIMKVAAAVGGVLLGAWLEFASFMLGTVYPVLIKVFGFLMSEVVPVVAKVVGAIAQMVAAIATIIAGLVNIVAGILRGDWGQMWEGAKQVFRGFVSFMGAMGRLMMTLLGAAFRALWSMIRSIFTTGFNLLNTITRGRLMNIVNAFRASWTAVTTVVRAAISIIATVVRTGFTIVSTIIRTIAGVIRAIISGNWGEIGGIIRGGISNITGAVSSGFSTIVNTIRDAVNRFKNAIQDGISEAVGFFASLGSDILGIVSGLGSALYNAGKSLMSSLASGIAANIGAAVGAVSGGLSRIRGLLPGSPIKWGPLEDWNRGGAGKRLINLLASGLEDTSPLDKAMSNVARYISAAELALSPTVTYAGSGGLGPTPVTRRAAVASTAAVRPARPTRKPKANGSKKKTLTVKGDLTMRNGRAYITGIAIDTGDGGDDFEDTLERMN